MNKSYWKKWFKATAIRTVRTMAETFISVAAVAPTMGEVNWRYVASATTLSGIITVALCVKGLPEVSMEE